MILFGVVVLSLKSCLVQCRLGDSKIGKSLGKCAEADRCCTGRDSSCVANTNNFDGMYFGTPCYCDEGCIETGDCCSDYKEICNIEGKKDMHAIGLKTKNSISSKKLLKR